MAVKIGSLIIRLAVEHGLLKSGLSVAEKEVKKTTKAIERQGRQIAEFGRNMALAVSLPMAAIAKSAVDGFVAQEKAMADVRAALASMGSASGKTADELLKTADALEMRSLVDADVILKQVTANLLTFGRISGQEFDRAQQAALDLSQRLGTDLTSATVMIGKALNDPVKGITAMSRAGIQFTEDQKAMIAGMVETGNVAAAQRIILAELEKQFGGAAAAAADASPWREAQVAIGQAMDAIGAAILPAIKPAGEAIAAVARAFASLPEGMQQVIVVAGVLAATLGPVLIGLGSLISAGAGTIAMLSSLKVAFDIGGVIKNLIPMVGALGRAMLALLANPVILAAAVVIGGIFLAWQNWDKIKPIIDRLTAAVVAFWTENVAPVLGALKDVLVGAVTWWWDMQVGSVRAIALLVTGVKDWLIGKLGAILDWVGDKISAVTGFFEDMYIAVVGNSFVPDMVEGIRVEMAKLQAFMVDPAQRAAKSVEEAMRGLAERVRGHLAELFPELVAAEEKAARIGDLFAAERAGIISTDTRQAAVTRAQGFDQGPLQEVEKVRSAAEALMSEMGRIGEVTKVQTVQIAESFRDMADKSIQAIDRMASAIQGGGFLDILGSAVNLFLQLGSTGLFGSKLAANINAPRIPGNANGTAFHPGGLMMVGERGPEVLQVPRGGRVIPNHELRAAGEQAIRIILDERTDIVSARIDGRIGAASGALAEGGARLAQARIARRQTRRIG